MLVAATGLVARMVVRATAGDQLTDDAYIFFRYSHNAARGHGLVYNVGHWVYGFTSPLYSALLVPFSVGGASRHLPTSALVIGLVLWVALGLVVGRLALRIMPMPWIAGTIFALYLSLVIGSMNGMETGLFMLTMFGTVSLLVTKRHSWALVLVAFCALTRPEGLVFAAIVGIIVLVWRPKPFPWRGAVAGVVLVGAWLAYARLAYGSLVPQSLVAKAGASGAGGIGAALRTLAVLAFGLSSRQLTGLGAARVLLEIGAVVALAVVALDIRYLVKRRSLEVALPLWFVGVWLGYVVARPVRIWSWYSAPTSAVLLWSAARQAGVLVGWAGERDWWPVWGRRAAAAVLILVLFGGLIVGTAVRTDNLHAVVTNLDGAASAVLAEDPHPRQVMLGDIGVVGFRLDRTEIYDLSALVTPAASKTDSSGRLLALGTLVEQNRPDAILVIEDPRTQTEIDTGSLRRASFADDAQKARFESEYVLIRRPPPGASLKSQARWVFLRRDLA